MCLTQLPRFGPRPSPTNSPLAPPKDSSSATLYLLLHPQYVRRRCPVRAPSWSTPAPAAQDLRRQDSVDLVIIKLPRIPGRQACTPPSPVSPGSFYYSPTQGSVEATMLPTSSTADGAVVWSTLPSTAPTLHDQALLLLHAQHFTSHLAADPLLCTYRSSGDHRSSGDQSIRVWATGKFINTQEYHL